MPTKTNRLNARITDPTAEKIAALGRRLRPAGGSPLSASEVVRICVDREYSRGGSEPKPSR